MDLRIKEISAKETYQIRHKVMWPKKSLDFVILDNDDEGMHFGLFKNQIMVSVISVFISSKTMQFRKFATLVPEQGKGYGSYLLNYIMNKFCNEYEIDKVWCNARVDKASFYENFGLYKTSNKFLKSGVEYVIMEKIT